MNAGLKSWPIVDPWTRIENATTPEVMLKIDQAEGSLSPWGSC